MSVPETLRTVSETRLVTAEECIELIVKGKIAFPSNLKLYEKELYLLDKSKKIRVVTKNKIVTSIIW